MTFHCSFCEKSQHEVRTLIVGPPAPNKKDHHTGICDECSSRLVNFLKKKDIIEKKGLKQITNTDEIESIIEKTLANNKDKVEQYKSGKEKLFGYFVGQVMQETKGTANPGIVNEILKKKLAN